MDFTAYETLGKKALIERFTCKPKIPIGSYVGITVLQLYALLLRQSRKASTYCVDYLLHVYLVHTEQIVIFTTIKLQTTSNN